MEAIKIFLASCREPVRLAVTGASLTLALALGNGPGRYPMKEVFLRFAHHDSSHEISDNAQARDLAAAAQHPWTDVLTLGWH